MAQYNLTNYWTVFTYEVLGRTHVQKLPVRSAATTIAPPNVVQLWDRDGQNNLTLQEFATEWTATLAPFFVPTTYTPITMDLYYQPDGALEPFFISSTSSGLTAGSAGGANTAALQITMTFKDILNKPFKVVLMEPQGTAFQREPYNSAPARVKSLMDWVVGVDSPIVSRANNIIGVKMNYTSTYNDRLTRKVYNVR